jgi:hypothetical protein
MRQIVNERDRTTLRERDGTVPVPDEYLSKVLKLIPAEVVSLYVALTGIVYMAGTESNGRTLFWIIFLICLIGTPLYLMRIAKVSNYLQIGISCLAFIIWAFAIGGQYILAIPGYQPIYGALLLPIFTFFVPMIIQ